ncbi:MAG: HEPN domain-containing protein [Bacteroidales bacterium]
MTIDENSRKNLVTYRIEQSFKTAEDAEFLISQGKLHAAVNRIYYSMFYMLTALALLYKFQTSKHLQLIGWFNKTFIKENIFERKYFKILDEIFKKRQKGDYEAFVSFNDEEVLEMLAEMKDFISTIEKFILDRINDNQ